MHYWREQSFQALKHAASESTAQGWSSYAAFCRDSERGLRRKALEALEAFMRSMEQVPEVERRRFVSWLLSIVEGQEGRDMLIPHPLRTRIVEPTLLCWVQDEPHSSEPHRWLGGREHLERALELDPGDHIARRKLIILLLSWIDYATHELPRGYLGTASEDLRTLDKVDSLLPALPDEGLRKAYAEAVVEERTAIHQYLRSYRKS